VEFARHPPTAGLDPFGDPVALGDDRLRRLDRRKRALDPVEKPLDRVDVPVVRGDERAVVLERAGERLRVGRRLRRDDVRLAAAPGLVQEKLQLARLVFDRPLAAIRRERPPAVVAAVDPRDVVGDLPGVVPDGCEKLLATVTHGGHVGDVEIQGRKRRHFLDRRVRGS